MPRELSPMEPDLGPGRSASAEPPNIALIRGESDGDDSVFVDQPDYEDSRPASREMPRIDLEALGAKTMATVNEQAKNRMMGEFAPMWHEMQGIDRELSTLSGDDFGEEEKKQKLLERRQAIEGTLRGPLRIANELISNQMGQTGRGIVQLQEAAASEYPEIADELLDLAQLMPLEQQSTPATYQLLAQQVYGRRAVAERGKARISNAGSMSGVVGGRSGAGAGPRYEVSSVEVRKLRNMGLKGAHLAEAVERLGR